MLAVVLLALAVGGGTAFAQALAIGGAIQCQGIPCVATGDGDVLFEQVGDGVRDRMLAQGNHDLLCAPKTTPTTATWPRVASETTGCLSTTATPWMGP
jgi:hypothetical protein